MDGHRVTIDLDAETAALVRAAADASGQTVEQFVVEAARKAALNYAEFMALVAEGDRDFAEGRTHSEEEVRAFLSRGIAEARAELARHHAAE